MDELVGLAMPVPARSPVDRDLVEGTIEAADHRHGRDADDRDAGVAGTGGVGRSESMLGVGGERAAEPEASPRRVTHAVVSMTIRVTGDHLAAHFNHCHMQ